MTIEYVHDSVGNRQSQKVTNSSGTVETTYTYDHNDRLTHEHIDGTLSRTSLPPRLHPHLPYYEYDELHHLKRVIGDSIFAGSIDFDSGLSLPLGIGDKLPVYPTPES